MARRTENAPLTVVGASALRREISARNLAHAPAGSHETTYGSVPSVLYREDESGAHGNFFPASYRRILAKPEWASRLGKTYTASARIVRGHERSRSELDCAVSSDALLMNIFCAPGVLRSVKVCALLGIEPGLRPSFGVRVRTPLRNGSDDRTEVDLQLGDLLLEAKFSEGDFQTAREDLLRRYEAFAEIFDTERLPARRGAFAGYQLIRGALAAHHQGARYGVLIDRRRPDLRDQFFAVLSAIQNCELRSRLLVITWQELAGCLSRPLQTFLQTKYGIIAG